MTGLAHAIDRDPVWRQWLAGTGAREIDVTFEFYREPLEDAKPDFSARRRKRELRIEWGMVDLGLPRESIAQQFELVTRHMTALLDELQHCYDLGERPALPPVRTRWDWQLSLLDG